MLTLLSATARADLTADADRAARMWGARGARIERLPSLFLEHGRVKAIAIRPFGPGELGCTSLVLVGDRSADFVIDGLDSQGDPRRWSDPDRRSDAPGRGEPRAKSGAGAAVLGRCGAERADLGRLVIEMRSTRGALEGFVVRSREPLGEVDDVLPERASGPLAPRGDPGRPIEPGPLDDRLARAEKRARLDGAAQVTRATMHASAQGEGIFVLKLAEGCHRIEVMAEVPSTVPRKATDIDAEVREAEAGRVLARDRADAPDSRLDLCLGETTVVEVSFIGAAGAVGVTASDARWPIASSVPTRWGARARGGFAAALRKRRSPDPADLPIFESLGVQGITTIPMTVEPGRCYLAAVSILRGESRGIRLTASLGDRTSRDEAVERPEGAAIAFCSESERVARIDIEMRGTSPWWALAVWAMGGEIR